MQWIISLLTQVFSDSAAFQKFLAALIERLVDDIDDVSGCKAKVLGWLQTGKLDDQFREDPLCVILCVMQVMLDFAKKTHDHDGPLFESPEENAMVFAYADCLDCTPTIQGPVSSLLLQVIVSKLAEVLAKLVQDWLND